MSYSLFAQWHDLKAVVLPRSDKRGTVCHTASQLLGFLFLFKLIESPRNWCAGFLLGEFFVTVLLF